MTSPEASDAELAGRAAGGDHRAFDLLMRRHKVGVHAFARRYVGDADAAYEVVQDTFVSAWRALKRYDRARPFHVWLRAIALNKCRDRGRRASVRRLIFSDRGEAPEGLLQADPGPGAEASLIDRQRLATLERAIAALPAQLKEPLILTVFDGLSHAEAGALLGINAKAVETRVYRARRRLAEALRELDPAGPL